MTDSYFLGKLYVTRMISPVFATLLNSKRSFLWLHADAGSFFTFFLILVSVDGEHKRGVCEAANVDTNPRDVSVPFVRSQRAGFTGIWVLPNDF